MRMTIPPSTPQAELLPTTATNNRSQEKEISSPAIVSCDDCDVNGALNTSRGEHKLSSRISASQSSIVRMQKLLLLLRHASKCKSETSELTGEEQATPCEDIKRCSAMKMLLKHMETCHGNDQSGTDEGNSCKYPHCRKGRYALWHYTHCSQGQLCPVCGPLGKMIGKESNASSPDEGLKRRSSDDSSWEGRQESSSKRRRVAEENTHGEAQNVIEGNRRNQTTSWDKTTLVRCEKLLQNLGDHQHGWVFMDPVDPVLLNIPDYFDIIKHPMDLGTINGRLQSGAYEREGLIKFRADVMLTFDNAISYNMEGTAVYDMAVEMRKQFLDNYMALMV